MTTSIIGCDMWHTHFRSRCCVLRGIEPRDNALESENTLTLVQEEYWKLLKRVLSPRVRLQRQVCHCSEWYVEHLGRILDNQ